MCDIKFCMSDVPVAFRGHGQISMRTVQPGSEGLATHAPSHCLASV